MGGVDVEAAVVVVVANGEAHARLGTAEAIDSAAEHHRPLLKAAATLIDKQEVGFGVVGDVEIDEAVSGEVGDRHPKPLVAGAEEAHLAGGIAEGAVAIVKEAGIGPGIDVAGMTDSRLALRVVAGEGIEDVVLQIVADVEIEVVVAVEVGPGGRGAPARVAGAALLGDVAKGSIAKVA